MRIVLLTGFPRIFEGPLDEGMIRVAREKGLVDLRVVSLRDHADDNHRTIDDYPYGGGPGMILKVEPVARAVDALPPMERGRRETILLTPQGERLTQAAVHEIAGAQEVVLLSGRYKGIDERIRTFVTREVSIGDYILSGGEIAALVLVDAVVRLIPGVLGDHDSARGDSFEEGILDCSYYTRPERFRGLEVPPVLLSGNHKEIERWRRRDALARTLVRRPDLLDRAELTEEDRRMLEDLGGDAPSPRDPAPSRRREE
ncbi:MAG: tRNA (guanosine(37)-N1)-methyltransferase TrmD [Candidatus Eisenbacteria bacterium]|nr:tRNA (guanosine(37)-N1)-methyltransferase TrmD [Candidatus Latescibacterota bacterium]MBD3301019.1 tRNA (guanosine(37)-N1)-methyltransferase TrmD [Candidatus Eisenbacteria bacterium]